MQWQRNIRQEFNTKYHALAVVGVADCPTSSNKAGYNMHGKRVLYIPIMLSNVALLWLQNNLKVIKSLEKSLIKSLLERYLA